jgi:hypothetical protein
MGNKVKILEIFLIFSLQIFMNSMLIMKIHWLLKIVRLVQILQSYPVFAS